MPGERVELHEGPGVEQHLQALAGGVAALGVLAEEVGSSEEEPVVPGTMHGHPAADTPLPRTDTVHRTAASGATSGATWSSATDSPLAKADARTPLQTTRSDQPEPPV